MLFKQCTLAKGNIKEVSWIPWKFAKKNKQYILQEDDVLLYSVGAYIGKANIYKKSIIGKKYILEKQLLID